MGSDEDKILEDIGALFQQAGATTLFQQAVSHYQGGRLTQAETLAQEILSRDPEHAEANHLLGLIAAQRGQYELAGQLIGRAIYSNPRQANYYNNLGFTLHNSGQLTEALAACERAIQLNPQYAEAHNACSNTLRDLGRLDEALAASERALELNPDYADAHINRGNALFGLRRLDEALAAYGRALQLQPESMSACNNVGLCFSALGKEKEAIKNYKRALQLSPENANVLANIGNSFLNLGKKKIAAGFYKKAISLKPDFFDAYYHYHVAVFREDDPSDAIAALRASLDATPRNNIVSKAWLAMLLDYSGDNQEAGNLFREIVNEDKDFSFIIDSWEYVKTHRTKNTRLFWNTFDSLRYAFANTLNDGLILEFGVRQGATINHIARQTRSAVHGFDSFEGLPEEWEGKEKGAYTTNSILPRVQSNINLHVGWFEDTLPAFSKEHQDIIRFINIDCDLYSSTCTIFEYLGKQIVPGSVIIFDEYIGNPHWRDDEYKAFQEFVHENNMRYEYLLFSPFSKQAAVIIR